MPTGVLTNDWISQSARILYQGALPPNKNKFYVALANTAVLTRASTIAEFITAEILPENGYQRSSINFGADGAFNTGEKRHELSAINPTFTASGNSLQFQAAFLIADAKSFSSVEFSSANVDAGNNLISIAAHPFSDGDKITFTPDETSNLPAGINAGEIYTVSNSATDTFQISTSITGTGSGTFYARSANGTVVALAVEDAPITVLDGQQYTYQIPLILFNGDYGSGI